MAMHYSLFPVDPYETHHIIADLCCTELFLKYLLRAVMFCIMSIDLGAVTFLHWLQMAAALLSKDQSDKGLLFSQLFLFSHARPFGSEQLLRH